MIFPEPISEEPLAGRTIDEFVKFVAVDENGCWIWTGYRNTARGGYGQFDVGRGRTKSRRAHRVAYECWRGPIEQHLDHLCRVPACVNPWHLEDVSPRENLVRWKQLRDRCKRGHLFTGETNCYGHRICRECHRGLRREYYWERGVREKQLVVRKCKSWTTVDGVRTFCKLLPGHDGLHRQAEHSWASATMRVIDGVAA